MAGLLLIVDRCMMLHPISNHLGHREDDESMLNSFKSSRLMDVKMVTDREVNNERQYSSHRSVRSLSLLTLILCVLTATVFLCMGGVGVAATDRDAENTGGSPRTGRGDNAQSSDIDDEIVKQQLRELAASASAAAAAGGGELKEQSPQKRPYPPPPCIDLDPECFAWAVSDECHTNPANMLINCPISCDLCNPSLTTESGIPQRTNFSNLYSSRRGSSGEVGDTDSMPNQRNAGEKATGSSRRRSTEHLERRVQHILTAMDIYLSTPPPDGMKLVSESCKNRHPHCALWAARGYCELKRRAMRESCAPVCRLCHFVRVEGRKDRHDEMKLWNQKGTTPFQRMDLVGIFEAMEEDRVVIPPGKKNGVDGSMDQPSSATRAGIIPEGMDLMMTDDQIYVLPLGQIKTFVFRLKPGTESAKASAKARKRQGRRPVEGDDNTNDAHNENAEDDDGGPYIVQFDRFLSPEECQALLSMIRRRNDAPFGSIGGRAFPLLTAIGSDVVTTEGDREQKFVSLLFGDDGFTPPSTELRTLPDGTQRVTRMSSRTYFNPPRRCDDASDQQQTEKHKEQRRQSKRFHPVMERLLAKIEMVTSVPAPSHVELPVQFEKFMPGGFHEADSHFADAMSTSRHKLNLEKISKSKIKTENQDDRALDELFKKAERDSLQMNNPLSQSGSPEHSPFSDGDPRRMRNARIFGMTIFLSDVDKGGEIVFPNMGNFTIEPMMGRAVLYPTVLNLIGKKGRESGGGDEKETDDGGGTQNEKDDDYLVEEMGTLMAHKPVLSGVKYTINVYLRRYPNDGV